MYQSMKYMLDKAYAEKYAVMAINCFNLETARSVIKAAELEKAPIIINIFQDHMVNHCDSEIIAPIVKTLAWHTDVPVALNYDHGTDIIRLKKAVDDGFSGVMIDASRYDLEENIAQTRLMVEYAHPRGTGVEGEIGCIGAVEGAQYTSDAMYTDPASAKKFADASKVDALAVSFGSSHGTYPAGMIPSFDFERLKSIKKMTAIPLVLHGGSGSGEQNIKQSVQYGINKINVGCDFMNANVQAVQSVLANRPDINFYDLVADAEEKSIDLVRYYIELSGSVHKGVC